MAEKPLRFRHWTGYDPEPDHRYLASIKSPGIPPQWHVEAASAEPAARAFTLTVLRPYRRGQPPDAFVRVTRNQDGVRLTIGAAEVQFPGSGSDFARLRKEDLRWTVTR